MPILSAFGAARIIGGNAPVRQPLTVSFLLVAGGGGSGGGSISTRYGGGGGGGEVLETLNQAASTGVAYDIYVGQYGLASGTSPATNGENSYYRTSINASAKGGGKGGQAYATANGYNGGTGGSGGGGYGYGVAGGVTPGSTGYAGAAGFLLSGVQQGAAGGGAGGPPTVNSTNGKLVNGGVGKLSAITGLRYGGGGAGYQGTASDGGGSYSGSANGLPGSGGGGAGRSGNSTTSGFNGGSGVVVLKIPDQYTASFSAGVTFTVTTSSGFKIYTISSTFNNPSYVTFS